MRRATVSKGGFEVKEKENYHNDRAISNISDKLKGFKKEELDLFISKETEKVCCSGTLADLSADVIELYKNEYVISDLAAP